MESNPLLDGFDQVLKLGEHYKENGNLLALGAGLVMLSLKKSKDLKDLEKYYEIKSLMKQVFKSHASMKELFDRMTADSEAPESAKEPAQETASAP
jgi:hypothetical protein